MKLIIKFFVITFFVFIFLTPTIAQTNTGSMTILRSNYVTVDQALVYSKVLVVSPYTPIKINYTLNTYDDLTIYTNDNSSIIYYVDTYHPTTGQYSVTIISTSGQIYIGSQAYTSGLSTDIIFSLNYLVDPAYTKTNGMYINGNTIINGNLGIGTTENPTENLEVKGTASFTDHVGIGTNSVANSKLNIFTNQDPYSLYIRNNYSSTSNTYGIYSISSNSSGPVYGIYSSVSGGGSLNKRWAGYFTGGDVEVAGGNLKVSGNVVIGTTITPLVKFQIVKNDTSKNIGLTNSAALEIWNPNATINTGSQINFRSDTNSGATGIGAVIGYLNKYSSSLGSCGDLVFGVKKSPYPDSSIMQAMTIQLGGNVGIGTTTPKVKIESVSGINAYPAVSNTLQSGSALRLRGGDNSILDFGLNSTNTWIQATNQTNLAYNYNICLNPNGGNVGIGTGTISPTAKLDVNGIIKTNADIQLGVSQVNSYLKMNTDSRTWWAGIGVISGDDRFDIYDATAGYYALTIGKDGNVGIGIGTATAAYKLEVKGTIHANEVIVDFKGTIADFVFKPTYKLMPLNQVEQFVKTNSHLPEIPSSSEIKKNGLSMGEMQNKLLQKVEELTLYVIEQQKEINLLKQELKK